MSGWIGRQSDIVHYFWLNWGAAVGWLARRFAKAGIAAKRETKHRGKTANPATRLLAHPSGDRVAVGYPRCARLGGKTGGLGGLGVAFATRVNRAGPSEARMGGRGGDRGKHPHKMKSAKAWIAAKRGDRGK